MKKMGISSNNIHSVLWKIAAVVWAGLIFHLSTSTYGPAFSMGLVRGILDYFHVMVSPVSLETIHHLLRKLAHPVEYAIFAMLIYGSSSESQPFAWRPRRALWCFLIAAAYSLTDEFHQRFVPGRTPALADCGIDSLGGAIGMFVYYLDSLVSRGSSV
ncbi:MAG: VanZ family protein [Terriglobia bacterium]